MKRLVLILTLVGAVGPGAQATSFYLTPDVPTDDPSAGSPTYLPWEVVRDDSGAYGSTLVLPDGTGVDALHRMNGGDWLLSIEVPTELPPGGGVFFDPRDVIRYDGATYSLFVDGGAVGSSRGDPLPASCGTTPIRTGRSPAGRTGSACWPRPARRR